MASSTPKTLFSLPSELLMLLPPFLHDIEDFKNLASTSHVLRDSCSTTSPQIIFRLAASATRIFFRPSPHFLISAVAPQLGKWARLSDHNESELREVFRGGLDAVLDLCLDPRIGCGLTMQRIRELHLMRFSVINPVEDLIDKCVGKQWYSTPNFWNGGVDDAWTINVEPSETIFHIAIYGGIFSSDFDFFIPNPDSTTNPTTRALTLETRLELIKYCLPDWACYACQTSARDIKGPDGSGPVDPRRAVGATGPYAPLGPSGDDQDFFKREHDAQIGLLHLLRSKRFNAEWDTAREVIGPRFASQWKQDLWESVVMFSGLDGLGIITPGGVEGNRRAELEGWRERIRGMNGRQPGGVVVGRQRTYEFPYLKGDLRILTSGYVGGT